MTYWIALAAAFGCAAANGLSAILQYRAVRQAPAQSRNLWQQISDLFRSIWYNLGLFLDGIGWILSIVAVHTLPLILAQSIMASSVAITALLDRLWLGVRLRPRTQYGIAGLVVGLILVTTTVRSSTTSGSAMLTHVLLWAPLGLAIVTYFATKLRHPSAMFWLATLAGINFAGTAIAGRVLPIHADLWAIVWQPLSAALVAYGIIGFWAFTIALRTGSATQVNAVMIGFQTLVPTLIGLLVLHDQTTIILLALSGMSLVTGCAIFIGLTTPLPSIQPPDER
jgi:drug/metabolite transporter (DMT)-like permease